MKQILPAAAIILSACAAWSPPYLDIGGATWRKVEAFSAPLFSVGKIETAGRNRFDPKGQVILNDFPIKALTHYHSEETATASLEAEAKWTPKVAEIAGDLQTKKEERLNGKYVVFRNLDTYGLIDKLNDPLNANTLVRLKQESKPVIVTGVAIVFDNEIYKKTDFSAGTKVTISSGSNSPVVKLKGASGSEIKAGFSDGTVFAYEYSQIEWDTSSSVPRVKHLAVDRPANIWF